MLHTDANWRPTEILQIGEPERTSTGVTRVLTDAGWAFCKPLGNRQGPHVLACEWVCIRLAKWFGLPTFAAAIVELRANLVFDLPIHKGQRYRAEPGPVFLTRSTPGRQWSSDPDDLQKLVNLEAVTRLVCFDMWVRNRDRHHSARRPNYGNVFFAETGRAGRYRLIAMDHTHCFDNGVLNKNLAKIDIIQDNAIYGLFSQFTHFLEPNVVNSCAAKLAVARESTVRPFVDELPPEWRVDAATRGALVEMLWRRAGFLAENLRDLLPGGGAAV